MNNLISDMSCKEFSAALASKAAVPGGGGAAALMGALGSALCSMAGNLTVGKKKYADVEPDIRLIIEKSTALCERFCALIDEDAAAFAPLAKAYSLPKDTENYGDIICRVTMDACQAPIEMMRCCCESIELTGCILDKCSKLVLSDVGCAAIAAKSALEAAALNVFVNTKSLNNTDSLEMEADAVRMLSDYSLRAESIYNQVLNSLRR